MARILETRMWFVLGCLFVCGCAEASSSSPCASSADCVATRMCVAGRCMTSDAEAPHDSGNPSNDAGDDASSARDAGDDTGRDARVDARDDDGGIAPEVDAGGDGGIAPELDAGGDAGCAGGCCRTDVGAACAPGSVCRPDSVGVVTGSCVACDASPRVMCALFAGGELRTVDSECEGYAAGASTVTRGTCRCGPTAACGGGQLCDYGVRHARDCSSLTLAPTGICVVPSAAVCDVLPRGERGCDGREFSDECERLSTSGMGVMAHYAVTCAAAPAPTYCYADADCVSGQSCYAQRDGCVVGRCLRDPEPAGTACYDATDCMPWQDCSTTCMPPADCPLGACFDTR